MQIVTELPTPHTDLAQCRQTLSGGSRSFWFASKLLPGTLRNDACGLYAFCREADDLIDEGDDPATALHALHDRLDRIYEGDPSHSATDRVLSRVVSQVGLPRELLNALLEGFAWDARGRRYETLSEVFDYSARVAGGIGVMMTVLMGVRDANALARAADLGVAMQLTNICRDVGEDARAGRLYLPLNLLDHAGIDAATFLDRPVFSAALGNVVNNLLTTADHLYHRAESGISSLPRGCRMGIYAARSLYAEIGERIRELSLNSVDQRAYVGTGAKLRLLAKSGKALTLGTTALHEAALPENQFLIDAVVNTPEPATANNRRRDSALGDFYQRMVWMLEAFAVLEARSLAAQSRQSQQRK